ncbi:LacI family transcriptional regulator [Cellulomonas soli]|uniref:LacI family transcriptional regulator n=1 Tax=Cellulomonas soli TaxID=931535 RepID=A0A512P8F5_9CELL|nr:LacI family transcriptional regulator [Cellulomonas soli]
MATIGDVARVAGVSRSTASYVMTGRRTMSPATQERVREAARSLGYTPNAGARALATKQTMVIGLLAQFLEDEFAPAMLQYITGVTGTARELGYDTLLVSEPDGAHALKRLTDSRMVDGVVLLNVAHDDDRLPVLRATDVPGVLIGLPGDPSGLDVFDLDFAESGRMMVEHLAALGHRELALVTQPEHVVARGGAYVWRLLDAAQEEAHRRGLRLHAVPGASGQPQIGQDLHALLDTHPAVTGLLLHNEAAAAALPSVMYARGLQAPRDLSVVGRYSDEFARTFSLPFSSIESAPDRLGQLAVRRLLHRIGAPGDGSPPQVLLLAPELVDRGSTGAPAPR